MSLHNTIFALKVIATTSDKASANQRLIKMHGSLYKARNMFAPERYIYFFSDAPHLVKTVRNNLHSSGGGRNSKRLWVSTCLKVKLFQFIALVEEEEMFWM